MPNLRKISKKLIPKAVFDKIEPTGHLAEAILANLHYGTPAKRLNVIGVTGTNGKTTTCFMIYKMLLKAGYKVALMTTVAYGVGKDIKQQTAHVTTLSAPKLQKALQEFKNQGAEWVVLETTSHALAQHRVWGIPYRIAVMTNITHEHLDYHKTFENYLKAKVKLFQIANHQDGAIGIINSDDPNWQAFQKPIQKSLTYGIKSGAIRARDIELRSNGSKYSAKSPKTTYQISVNIPGEFNVYNSLATIAVGEALGLEKNLIEQGIASLDSVEGRMNSIDLGQKFGVIIDFAHTPDAFERLLSDARKLTKGKLIVMFGSAGRRDVSKRATQGEIAGKYADEVILTEEDDRDIDGNKILEQIAKGTKKSGKTPQKDLFLELNRSKAIELALSRAKSQDDLVMLLGKGHEKTIERADGEHSWNEKAEVEKYLKALITKG